MIGLALTTLVLVIVGLAVWQRRPGMPCRCIRGTEGRYVTVYTREKPVRDSDDTEDESCGQGEMDDLDLGNGGEEGGSSEGGRAMILLNTFRDGYRRLKTKDGESSRDLTSPTDV